jgi:phosphatidylglycerophosphatase A
MKTISPISAGPALRAKVARVLREQPLATIFATGFGVGLAPVAPGTAGSALALAAGWIAVAVFSSHMPSVVAGVGLLTSGLLVGAAAVPVTTRISVALADSDPGCIVLDEIAGQLIASAVVPLFAYPSPGAAAAVWITSFLAFRVFDVWKPGPIRDWQDLPGGWGIVIDDLAAGALAAGLTAGVAAFVSRPG